MELRLGVWVAAGVGLRLGSGLGIGLGLRVGFGARVRVRLRGEGGGVREGGAHQSAVVRAPHRVRVIGSECRMTAICTDG